jgi:hypothetical protein
MVHLWSLIDIDRVTLVGNYNANSWLTGTKGIKFVKSEKAKSLDRLNNPVLWHQFKTLVSTTNLGYSP